MEEEMYFLVTCSEGGTMFVEQYTKDKVMEALSDHGLNPENAFHKLEEPDPNYWRGNFLLVKGKMVQPKPRDRVVDWDLE